MKKGTIFLSVLALVAIGFSSCATMATKQVDRPAIVIAAFGSSYETGLKNLEDFDSAVLEAFPDADVYWAFTANFIVKKLRARGQNTIFAREVEVRSLDEVYEMLLEKGQTVVLVQSLHLMVGEEYREVLTTPAYGLNVKYSHPMLFYPENVEGSVVALSHAFGTEDDTLTILCAHGNEKHLEYNSELIQIDSYLRENYENTYLTVMEGEPNFDDLFAELDLEQFSKVKFITFMLTFGDHMSNDVMGDEEDALKVRLGLEATITDGMASDSYIQNLFISNMKDLLTQF